MYFKVISNILIHIIEWENEIKRRRENEAKTNHAIDKF